MDLLYNYEFYIQTLVLFITFVLTSSILTYYTMPRLLFTSLITIVLLISPFRRRKYIQVDKEITACYMERGLKNENLPTVILLHGFCSFCTDFCKFAALIDKEYHVIALDMLNHGGTTALDKSVIMSNMTSYIKKFVEKKGLNKIHIMGFSTGGAVAAAFASRFPELTGSLVIGCPPGATHTNKPEKLMGEMSIDELRDFIHMMSLGKMKVPTFFIVAWLDYIKNNYWKTHRVFEGILDGPTEFKFTPDFMKNMKTNTLVVWGDDDRVCETRGVKLLKEHIPNSTTVLIENCGHLIWETHAQKLSDVINDWLCTQDKH